MSDSVTETFDVYEDDDGNEFILVDGEFVPLDDGEYAYSTEDDQDAPSAPEPNPDDGGSGSEPAQGDGSERDEEVFEVFEDENGVEYIVVDGQRVDIDPDEYEVVEADDSFNPFAYESVQAATDVANDLARAGGSIAREGAALANDAATIVAELQGAMEDITTMLDPKKWIK